jgi:hypothetical protein
VMAMEREGEQQSKVPKSSGQSNMRVQFWFGSDRQGRWTVNNQFSYSFPSLTESWTRIDGAMHSQKQNKIGQLGAMQMNFLFGPCTCHKWKAEMDLY